MMRYLKDQMKPDQTPELTREFLLFTLIEALENNNKEIGNLCGVIQQLKGEVKGLKAKVRVLLTRLDDESEWEEEEEDE